MAEAMDVARPTMSRNMPTTLLPGKLAGDREISAGYITTMRVSVPFSPIEQATVRAEQRRTSPSMVLYTASDAARPVCSFMMPWDSRVAVVVVFRGVSQRVLARIHVDERRASNEENNKLE